jgi:hypothetical protein
MWFQRRPPPQIRVNSTNCGPLIHFAKTPATVISILASGFVYVANRRGAVESLLPAVDFGKREPQQFGMISFRECSDTVFPAAHSKEFGQFGIAVAREWALRFQAKPVRYISEVGPEAEELCVRFQSAFAQLESILRSDPTKGFGGMERTNKHMAAIIGAPDYFHVLSEFEFLAPVKNRDQREWRIVNPHPNYSASSDPKRAVAAVTSRQGWPQVINCVKVGRSDVSFFVCPAGRVLELRNSLPIQWQGAEIRESRP